MADVETKFCNNCKKDISANNFMMHEVHCFRNIALCKHCKEPIPKGEMEVHFEENHAKIACPKCSVEVEKMNLEEHEENSCQKRPMDCVYCQLKVPKGEFDAHIDYCGSRTEQCPKCAQYIKKKDQTKHEDSMCRYPEVKPSNTNRVDAGGPLNGHGNEYLSGLPQLNSFTMDELSRVLSRPAEAGRSRPPPPVRQEARAVDQDRRKPRLQNVAVKRATKATVKPDVNKQRGVPGSLKPQASQPAAGPTENDYDHLLAMHLAQDLNPDDDMDALMRQFEKPPSPQSPTYLVETPSGRSRNTFSEDMVMIPCEFCGEPFETDDLVQHQSGCSLDRISDVLPTLISPNNRSDAVNNARGRTGGSSPVIVDPPAIINNLRNFDAEPWLDDTAGYPMEIGDDDMMLPCEFCDEPFPMDGLVQHQAFCDKNTTMTPRVTSPVIRPMPQRRIQATPGFKSDFPNLSSRRHQAPPEIELDEDSDDEPSVRPKQYTIGATHRVRKPNTTAAASSTSIEDSAIDNIDRALRNYRTEPQDRGDRNTRQRGNIRHNVSDDSDSWLQSGAKVQNARTTAAAAPRSRNVVDNLLNNSDQGSSSHDLLGHIGASRKPVRSDLKPVTRKIASSHTTAVTSRAATNTKARVTSRDALPETNRNSTSTSQPKPRTVRPNFEVRVRPVEADETSPMVRGVRPREAVATTQSRTRANHMFGANNSTTTRTTRKRTDANCSN